MVDPIWEEKKSWSERIPRSLMTKGVCRACAWKMDAPVIRVTRPEVCVPLMFAPFGKGSLSEKRATASLVL
ncbi:hypothetical protein MPNT_60109 [Candidatus Methylacidithermus pantelleriae]|uniref:Uncharacterized protein n=1 Tax=Candidatus Methylacidithermus pantelleriae TaxID=2744239 RepID=A0A8J2BLS0_9BACT|nr:hypothetical protein MPNT_60109 [Candidatus Methylacidithermus pantelleriae]